MSIVVKSTPEVAALMDELARSGMPAEAVEIYRARNVVAKLPDKGINIKEFKVPGLAKGLIYGLLRKPKAQRAYDNALELKRLGIATPEPLGVLLDMHGGRLGRSYYVCRQLEGWNELRGAEKRSDFKALARALARFTLDMHGKGVYMKDMTPGNILFRAVADGRFDFALVDINRMEFGVTDTELLRSRLGLTFDTEEGGVYFARCYAGLAGIDADIAEERARSAYRARWAAIRRKQRIKAALGINHH